MTLKEIKLELERKGSEKNLREESVWIAKVLASHAEEPLSVYQKMIEMIDDGQDAHELVQYAYDNLPKGFIPN